MREAFAPRAVTAPGVGIRHRSIVHNDSFAERAPEVGEAVETPDGEGHVIGHNVPGEKVVVRMTSDGRRTACALASVCASRKSYDARGETISDPASGG